MKIKDAFYEDTGFSWRKTLACICGICFMTAVIGYLIVNDFEALPGSYLTIIGGVFVFYFGKEAIKGIKVTNGNAKT